MFFNIKPKMNVKHQHSKFLVKTPLEHTVAPKQFLKGLAHEQH